MKSIVKLVTMVLVLAEGQLLSQDARLLQIKSIYILPNGDEKETDQFIEKIPKEL